MSQALDPVTANHISQAADRLAEEFAGVFSRETVARCMSESQLFVCVHNAGRRRMAAGLLRLRSGGRINVRCAGSTPTVIAMGCGDACPVFPGQRYEDWQLDDPAEQDLETVRRIHDEIDRRVRRLIGELLPDGPAPAS
jgi:arsenate reductase (thioredoxin)